MSEIERRGPILLDSGPMYLAGQIDALITVVGTSIRRLSDSDPGFRRDLEKALAFFIDNASMVRSGDDPDLLRGMITALKEIEHKAFAEPPDDA